MIVRYLNVIALIALVGSAAYAYSTKYATMLYAAKIQEKKNFNKKLRSELRVLEAEWAHVTRPGRLQALADKHLPLQQMKLDQVASFADLPDRPPKTDSIGRKLKALGLSEPTQTPRSQPSARTGIAPKPTDQKHRSNRRRKKSRSEKIILGKPMNIGRQLKNRRGGRP